MKLEEAGPVRLKKIVDGASNAAWERAFGDAQKIRAGGALDVDSLRAFGDALYEEYAAATEREGVEYDQEACEAFVGFTFKVLAEEMGYKDPEEEDAKSRVEEWVTQDEVDRLMKEEFDRLEPEYPNGVPEEVLSKAWRARIPQEYPALGIRKEQDE